MEMSARKPLLPRRVLDLPIDALRPNPNQPRIEFDEASLRSLSDSIRRYGILQPLTVRRTDEGSSRGRDGCARQSSRGCARCRACSRARARRRARCSR